MNGGRTNLQLDPDATPLRCLAQASRELSSEPDAVKGLWKLICALREDLGVDRAGVFAYDSQSRSLDRVAGVDRNGQAEYSGQCFQIDALDFPLFRVARREIPYYLSEDARPDYPDGSPADGVRALAIIPIMAGDELLGVLCADNCLTGRPIPEALLQPFFLYAGLAALPLFALYQKKERERLEATRRHILREMLYSVTSGKIILCDRPELEAEWPRMDGAIQIQREEDVRVVREAARALGAEAGMDADRLADFALCASEGATNALLHGNGGAACVAYQDGKVRIRIIDYGAGIDPENLPRATLLKGWSGRASTGLGFTVMNEIADRLYLHTGADGTMLIMEMGITPANLFLSECNPLLWSEDGMDLLSQFPSL